MSETPREALGPAPFRFEPAAGPSVEGPAFSPTFKALATLLVLAIVGWMLRLWLGERVQGSSLLTWFTAAAAMLVYLWTWILRSRTRIDAQELRQTWFADKRMAVGELAVIGLVRFRGLEWLIAPRLQARNLMGKYAVFHAADPKLLDEFERMQRELKAFRQS